MFQIQYRWVFTPFGYQLVAFQVFVPVYTFAPVFYYYW